MQARLAKVKQRKQLKGEIPAAEEDNDDEEGGDVTGAKTSNALEERLANNADKSYDMLLGKTKKATSMREWDIGKGNYYDIMVDMGYNKYRIIPIKRPYPNKRPSMFFSIIPQVAPNKRQPMHLRLGLFALVDPPIMPINH